MSWDCRAEKDYCAGLPLVRALGSAGAKRLGLRQRWTGQISVWRGRWSTPLGLNWRQTGVASRETTGFTPRRLRNAGRRHHQVGQAVTIWYHDLKNHTCARRPLRQGVLVKVMRTTLPLAATPLLDPRQLKLGIHLRGSPGAATLSAGASSKNACLAKRFRSVHSAIVNELGCFNDINPGVHYQQLC